MQDPWLKRTLIIGPTTSILLRRGIVYIQDKSCQRRGKTEGKSVAQEKRRSRRDDKRKLGSGWGQNTASACGNIVR